MKKICKNCRLYNEKERVCSVTVIRNGEYYELKTNPDDECHWQKAGIEIQQIKMWSDGKDGYIEVPQNFPH